MLATIPSATLLGVDGRPVTVEVHVSNGLPGFTIVGQPDAACREARDRVRAALLSSGLSWPLKRVTVNLAPSGLRKVGAGLDLPILVGLLVAGDVLPAAAVDGYAFLGEVGLDGSIRAVPGTLALLDALGTARVVVAPASVAEARLVGRHEVRCAPTVAELLAALTGEAPWPDAPPPPEVLPSPPGPDLADVHGHPFARLALEAAAAGGHHLLLVGPPGSGKTMLASRLPGVLPALGGDAALTTTRIHSAAGLSLPPSGLVTTPPLRAPHHGASAVALVGGGTSTMRPGEASLAHNGVLFLDELGEFHRDVLDQLRQPLEEGVVRVARAKATVTFPARFLLVAAMNPCPCGQGGPTGWCRCSDRSRARYASRLSGPLLDRFDLRVLVARPDAGEILAGARGESSADVAARVASARRRATERGVACNAQLDGATLDSVAPLSPGGTRLLDHALRSGGLSARGLQRIRRVALTLADLDGDDGSLSDERVATALALRADGILDVAA